MTLLRIGTRASTLARAQSALVGDRLHEALGVDVELVEIVSEGDQTPAPLAQVGGMGLFVGALRSAVIAGGVDVAVHSLKDLPTQADHRVTLAAVPTREDPRDALVARGGLTLGELPAGSRVGTGSPRRAAQLRALGLGLDVVGIRGNVDTRLAKVASGAVDGVVLARAGLLRLGRESEITENLDPIQMLPAPGQGALAVEVAAKSRTLGGDIAAALDDPPTRAAVGAERALLRTLGAGCSAPVGALADLADGDDGLELWLRGVVCTVDGGHVVRLSAAGPLDDADGLGRRLAEEMLAAGGARLMEDRAS